MSFSRFGVAASQLAPQSQMIAKEMGRRSAATLAEPVLNGGSTKKKLMLGLLSGAALGSAALVYSLENGVHAMGHYVHPPELPWTFHGFFGQQDTASIRRGWQVYKQVCHACHHLENLRYFHMINVCMTEQEARAEAAAVTLQDGPDAEGHMFARPARLYDYIPPVHYSDESAASANNGAIPPSLGFIVLARKERGGADYVYHLLMGYPEEEDLPAGVTLGVGQAYNPYFEGGVISMPRQLYNDGVEYDDGTIPTASQQAKDVTSFMQWLPNRRYDYNKQQSMCGALFLAAFCPAIYWLWKHNFRDLQTMKCAFRVVPGREPHRNTYYPAPNVFEQTPAKFEDRLSQHSPNDVNKIYAASRHLYKSHAPRYQFKNNYPGHEFVREMTWKYAWRGHMLGFYFNDTFPRTDGANEVANEAVTRIPPWERDARQRRTWRAMCLAANHESLPKREWTRYEEETWYLFPYIDQVQAEMVQHSLNNLPGKPKWFTKHRRNRRWGVGKSGYEANYMDRLSKA